MSKRTRYLLLLLGFAVFLIAAPLIVLYVRGITYDFTSKSFVQTGIFSVRTEPENVDIFLNNKLKRQSSGDINFVTPGQYQVTLKKDGYQTWSKLLDLEAGQVTYVNPANNPIYLFFSSPKAQNLSGGVLDFYTKNNSLLFLTAQTVVVSQNSNPLQQTSYVLPETVNRILATDDSGNFVLADNTASSTPDLLLFNSKTGNFIDLSGLFPNLPQIQFDGNGNLFALSDNVLYQINPAQKTKTSVLQDVKTFYFQGSNLYYIAIAQNSGQLSLNLSQAPFTQNQELVADVPQFIDGQLLVTFGKQIFLLADNNLYQANTTMQPIASGISQSNLDPDDSNISIFHNGEFDYYDTFGQNLNFVTRSGQPLNNLGVNNSIGYAFYANGSGINAIELDTRDSQNQYILYQSPNVQKFTVGSSGQNIILLDGQQLKSLTIR